MLEGTRFHATPVVNRHLGVWNPPTFTTPVNESIYVIPPENVGRPDKISFDVYGTVVYDLLILYYNRILDPFTELTSGRVLKIPALESVTWNA